MLTHPLRSAIGISVLLHGILLILSLQFRVTDVRVPRGAARGAFAIAPLPIAADDPVIASPVPEVDPGSASLDSTRVSERLADVVADSERQSTDEKLAKLDGMSRQLATIASDKSVAELAGHFQRWMKLTPRAATPVLESGSPMTPPAERLDRFDANSAQFQDVQRRELASGRHQYLAILVDAAGNTLELEMTEAEGRELYELMQRLQRTPLLRKVYQSIAMPLLDNLLRAARGSQEASAATADSTADSTAETP